MTNELAGNSYYEYREALGVLYYVFMLDNQTTLELLQRDVLEFVMRALKDQNDKLVCSAIEALEALTGSQKTTHALLNHDIFLITVEILLSAQHQLDSRLSASRVVSLALIVAETSIAKQIAQTYPQVCNGMVLALKLFKNNKAALELALECTHRLLRIERVN